MAGQKNKTTHKHNYKIIDSGPYKATYNKTSIDMEYETHYCICGDCILRLKHKYQMIYLPPDLSING